MQHHIHGDKGAAAMGKMKEEELRQAFASPMEEKWGGRPGSIPAGVVLVVDEGGTEVIITGNDGPYYTYAQDSLTLAAAYVHEALRAGTLKLAPGTLVRYTSRDESTYLIKVTGYEGSHVLLADGTRIATDYLFSEEGAEWWRILPGDGRNVPPGNTGSVLPRCVSHTVVDTGMRRVWCRDCQAEGIMELGHVTWTTGGQQQ